MVAISVLSLLAGGLSFASSEAIRTMADPKKHGGSKIVKPRKTATKAYGEVYKRYRALADHISLQPRTA